MSNSLIVKGDDFACIFWYSVIKQDSLFDVSSWRLGIVAQSKKLFSVRLNFLWMYWLNNLSIVQILSFSACSWSDLNFSNAAFSNFSYICFSYASFSYDAYS